MAISEDALMREIDEMGLFSDEDIDDILADSEDIETGEENEPIKEAKKIYAYTEIHSFMGLLLEAETEDEKRHLMTFYDKIRKTIENNHGRIISSDVQHMKSNIMIFEFDNPVEAAKCMLNALEVVKKFNKTLPLDRTLEYSSSITTAKLENTDNVRNVLKRLDFFLRDSMLSTDSNVYDNVRKKLDEVLDSTGHYHHTSWKQNKNIKKEVSEIAESLKNRPWWYWAMWVIIALTLFGFTILGTLYFTGNL